MAMKYNKLWKLLIDRGMTKTELRLQAGISSATLAKLSANKIVSMEVIGKLCSALSCDVGDICEYIPEDGSEE